MVPRDKDENMFGFVLTGSTFISRHFMELYYGNGGEIKEMREMVRSYNNCEDIAINYLVSYYYPELVPVLLKGEFKLDTTPVARSHKPVHLSHRTDCLKNFTLVFGVNPLRLTHSLESAHSAVTTSDSRSFLEHVVPVKRRYYESTIIGVSNAKEVEQAAKEAQEEKELRDAEKQGSQTKTTALHNSEQANSYLYERNLELTKSNELLKHQLEMAKRGPSEEDFVEFVREELQEEKRQNYMRGYLELGMGVAIAMLGWLLCVQPQKPDEDRYGAVPTTINE